MLIYMKNSKITTLLMSLTISNTPSRNFLWSSWAQVTPFKCCKYLKMNTFRIKVAELSTAKSSPWSWSSFIQLLNKPFRLLVRKNSYKLTKELVFSWIGWCPDMAALKSSISYPLSIPLEFSFPNFNINYRPKNITKQSSPALTYLNWKVKN